MTVGNLKPVVGTQFSDDLEGNNLEIVYGLKGNDLLSTSTGSNPVGLLGGEGDDEYLVRDNSFTVILETGNSNGDTIIAPEYEMNGENTYSLTIDNRHLYTADLDTGTYALILDWRNNTVIDKFELYDGDFTYQEATNFFDQLVESNNPHFLGNFTWDKVQNDPLLVANGANLDLSRLGLSSDTINAAIEEVKTTEANFQSTITSLTPNNNLANAALTTDDNSYIFQNEKVFYDFYSLPVENQIDSGDIVNITVSSSDFDPLLMVLDSKGNVLKFDNDGGGGTDAELTFGVGSGEPLFVSVESRNPNETGNYNLSTKTVNVDISGVSPDNAIFKNAIFKIDSIQTRDSVTGSLSTEDSQIINGTDINFEDNYLLVGGNVGQQVRVTLNSAFDGELSVSSFDSSGKFSSVLNIDAVAGAGIEQGTFNIAANLDYVISVDSVDPNITGNYTLTTEVI